jgi:hypothetical protein
VASANNSAARDKGHTGALYSKNKDRAAAVGMALFTTALGLYGGVLFSGGLRGPILHEAVPAPGSCVLLCSLFSKTHNNPQAASSSLTSRENEMRNVYR